MEEELSLVDQTQLLKSASDFAYSPVVQNEASTKEFLNRFPLPFIISALQTKADVPGLETTLVACLERIFKTKLGASLIPHNMPFVHVGLMADSQAVKCLACKALTCFLENFDDKSVSAIQMIAEYDIYPLLLNCLVHGNEQVAAAATDAIKCLASFPDGMAIVFPASKAEATHLWSLASHCSSLGRVRVFSLIVKLFSISSSVASVIQSSNLLSLLEEEIRSSTDILTTLTVLELLYELADVQHGIEYLSRMNLPQLLASIISNTSLEGTIRSRAMMISGRLLCKENIYMLIDESLVSHVISVIVGRLGLIDSQDTDEHESAIEALGQIGILAEGARLLLSSPEPPARYVVCTAFDRQARGKQLAALHALANLAGETRPPGKILLNSDAEECLRLLIYGAATESSKLTPSGLFLSVLQQASEFRLGAYRMITGLVARSWCLMEISSKQEIISILTDPTTETTKRGMEVRYNCCKAVYKAFASSKLIGDPTLAVTAEKLEQAIRKGPYLARKQGEAQPVVMTEQRF